jgi:hypothetical protein
VWSRLAFSIAPAAFFWPTRSTVSISSARLPRRRTGRTGRQRSSASSRASRRFRRCTMAGLGSSCRWVPLSFLFSPSSYRLRLRCLYPSFNALYFYFSYYFIPPLILTSSLRTCLAEFTKPSNPEKFHNTKPYNAFLAHPAVADQYRHSNSRSCSQYGH